MEEIDFLDCNPFKTTKSKIFMAPIMPCNQHYQANEEEVTYFKFHVHVEYLWENINICIY